MGSCWLYTTLWETALSEVTLFSRKINFSTNLISIPQISNLRSWNQPSKSTQLRVTRVSLLSRNFGYQLLSSRFHRFVICMHMMRYSKWEDWSLTITNSVHCFSAAFPALNVTCIKLISHVKCIVSPIKSPINQYYVDKPSIGLKMKKIIYNKKHRK